MKKIKYLLLVALGLLLTLSACSDDYLDVEFTDGATEKTLKQLDLDRSATASLLGMYATFATAGYGGHDSFGFTSVFLSTDLMTGDVLPLKYHWFKWDYLMDNRMYAWRRTKADWGIFYTVIANANNLIDLLEEGDETKAYLGQAYAMRGMAYDYLIQLYQKGYTGTEIGSLPGVPMHYSSKEGVENKMGRNTVKEVLDQAGSDLKKAAELIKGYNRPSKMYLDENVVNGLLARHLLLVQDYQGAYEAATKALEGNVIAEIVPNDIAKGDIKENRYMSIEEPDWMWGFAIDAETSGTYASFFSHISNLTGGYAGLGYSPKAIDKKLYDSMSDTDVRKTFYNPANYLNYKFGGDSGFTQDYVYMRSSEMVLIQAEALAHQGKNAEAATTLKVLMEKRDASWNKTEVSVEDVFLQRRIELWGEGFSYFDFKRLGVGRDTSYPGTNHGRFGAFVKPAGDVAWTYQIPRQEMQENKELEGQQNP